MHIAKWAILLSIFWLLLSGFIQPLLLSFGAISVAIVLIVLKRMDDVDDEPRSLSSGYRIANYITWLIGQIVRSSAHVTKMIWLPNTELSPSLAKIPLKELSSRKHVLYANSITLTPGTLSVDLDHDSVTVHALQEASLDELKKGEMENKITSIWRERS